VVGVANEGGNGCAKPRVLVIDDSKLIRFSAKKILGEDYDVVLAEDGEAGWSLIESDPEIQVAFTDLSMPVLDGFGLLQRLRSAADPRIHEMPLIVVTSGEEEDTRRKAYELGATDFIGKPFDSVSLLARAKAHVRSVATTRSLRDDAAHDEVTGLRSREYFVGQLRRDRALVARHGHGWSLVLLELAQFRELFLKNGKEQAHRVLTEVGAMVRRLVREEDTAARFGLAQIALSMPMTDADGAAVVAERLRREIASADFRLRADSVPVTPALAILAPDPAATDAERCMQRLAAATNAIIGKRGGGIARLREAASAGAASRAGIGGER